MKEASYLTRQPRIGYDVIKARFNIQNASPPPPTPQLFPKESDIRKTDFFSVVLLLLCPISGKYFTLWKSTSARWLPLKKTRAG